MLFPGSDRLSKRTRDRVEENWGQEDFDDVESGNFTTQRANVTQPDMEEVLIARVKEAISTANPAGIIVNETCTRFVKELGHAIINSCSSRASYDDWIAKVDDYDIVEFMAKRKGKRGKNLLSIHFVALFFIFLHIFPSDGKLGAIHFQNMDFAFFTCSANSTNISA